MYTGQNIVKLAYGDRLIRPKTPKVKTLPIAYNITEAHTDFPIYIQPSSITGFGSLTLAEAQSLRFYADAGKTTELPREIVSADEIYVKNTLATGTGNKLYLDWDGVSSDYAVSDTYGARNVWNSNYKAVYHFEGNANDSTSNGNNGTGNNMTYSGGAGVFNGSTSNITVTGSPSLVSNWSIGFIVKTSSSIPQAIYSKWISPSSGRQLHVSIPSNKLNIDIPYRVSNIVESATAVNDGNYHYIAITKSGNVWSMYIDGVLSSSATNASTQEANTNQLTIGKDNTTSSQYLNGLLDEIKIVSVGLSSSRISTEYANQSNPATFFGTLS